MDAAAPFEKLPRQVHFFWEAAILRGKTPVGSATVELLRINQPERVDHRRLLMELEAWTSS
ncbi:MAG: hypothetical protein L0228_21665 [Planctomycetes bacterium]|nr:hypothetical protein [Planctomycetota bacterium]